MPDQRPARLSQRAIGSYLLVGLLLPAVVTLVAVELIAGWRSQLPDPMAVHFSGRVPDGYGSVTGWLVSLIGVGIGLPVFFAVIVALGRATARAGFTTRFLGATAAWSTTTMAVLFTWLAAIQRGVEDAHQVRGPGALQVIGVMAGALVVGLLAWFVQPRPAEVPDGGVEVEPLPGDGAGPMAWTARSNLAGPVLGLLLAVQVLTFALTVVGAHWGTARWLLAAVFVLFSVQLLIQLNFDVRVDPDGLAVRSLLGWPRYHFTLDRITAVTVREVHALSEFGGWGLRMTGRGKRAVVLRNGPAIQVDVRPGEGGNAQGVRRFLITTPDAESGARVLQSLRGHARRGPSDG